MPPKKKADKKTEPEEEPSGYNINFMTPDQLKQYARALENEIEDMRKQCNFYHKLEDKLVELMMITEDDLRYNEDTILFKDAELEKSKLHFQKHLLEKRQWSKYMEDKSCSTKENLLTETSDRLEKEEERHLNKSKLLKMELLEKDKQLEEFRIKLQMARRETEGVNEKYLKETEDRQESLLKQIVSKLYSTRQDFFNELKQTKRIINDEALEEKIEDEKSFKKACEAFKRKLQNYYKDVTRQDLDVIKKLKKDISKVEESITSSKVLLKKATDENEKLTDKQLKLSKRNSDCIVSKFDANPLKMKTALNIHNRTEKLSIENQNLVKQIRNVMEQTFNLRRHFTLALKKVRENAELKANILERKLESISNGKQQKKFPSDTHST